MSDKITVSVINADVGSIGGHLAPGAKLLETVKEAAVAYGQGSFFDLRVTHTGDDVALLMTHRFGVGSERIHWAAWEAFQAGTKVAREQGLYAAGQDILKDAFSGNVRGMGPGVAEMEFDERPGEAFVVFAADKTDPGVFNLPLYLAFADVMNTPGLILSPSLSMGFRFVVLDMNETKGDRIIELDAPEDLYSLAALLRDPERYAVESVWSRASGEQAAAVSTTRLRNIAGKYTGKDDPVAIVRVQMNFPATGEILAPYSIGHFVGGAMRGSHQMPLMPVRQNSGTSYFDGPPMVSAAAYSMHQGALTEAVDVFEHPFWEAVRERSAVKAMEMRRQGFVGTAMLPMSELEYTGITERLSALDPRFRMRTEPPGKANGARAPRPDGHHRTPANHDGKSRHAHHAAH